MYESCPLIFITRLHAPSQAHVCPSCLFHQVDLVQSTSQTLPFENLKQVRLQYLHVQPVCMLQTWNCEHKCGSPAEMLTPPFDSYVQVQTLCVSPDGALMLSIDEEGKALLINRARGVLLHHFSFKGPVAVAKFSPDGKYVAVGVGRLLQVGAATWCSTANVQAE